MEPWTRTKAAIRLSSRRRNRAPWHAHSAPDGAPHCSLLDVGRGRISPESRESQDVVARRPRGTSSGAGIRTEGMVPEVSASRFTNSAGEPAWLFRTLGGWRHRFGWTRGD